jgi:hypothetical protein
MVKKNKSLVDVKIMSKVLLPSMALFASNNSENPFINGHKNAHKSCL